MDIFTDALKKETPYCVYAHSAGPGIFYIGSGFLARAFDHGRARRSPSWGHFVDKHGPDVTVHILSYHADRVEARRAAYGWRGRARPIGNMPGLGEHEPLVVVGLGVVASDPYAGRGILVMPGGVTYRNASEASAATGISVSAICNSCSGKYPVVAGKRFQRVDL